MLLLLLLTPWIWRRILSASLIPAVTTIFSIGDRPATPVGDRCRKQQQAGSEDGNPVQ